MTTPEISTLCQLINAWTFVFIIYIIAVFIFSKIKNISNKKHSINDVKIKFDEIDIKGILENSLEERTIEFVHKDWRGVESNKYVIPIHIYYGTTMYYSKAHWIVRAYDLNQKIIIDFPFIEIKDIKRR